MGGESYLDGDDNKSLGWFILAYLQGMDIPEFMFTKLLNEHNAYISTEVKEIFKATGKYRYYQFGYVDIYGGYEFF